MKQQILRYWLAMNASAFDSAVVATKAYVGGAVGHTISDSIPAISVATAGGIFGAVFALGVLNFLSANPVAKLFPAPARQDNLEKVNQELGASQVTEGK